MKRIILKPRENWVTEVEHLGMFYHTLDDGTPYWDESACYYFTAREIDEIEAATEELQRLCLEAGQFIIDNDRFGEFGIPEAARPVIKQAWEKEPPSLYGRFDLAYDGSGPPKLLEYNANTPTALLEAAVIQWYWRQEVRPATDQFNSVHEKLIAKWKDLKPYLRGNPLYFTSMQTDEDAMTITYLRDTAQQASIETAAIAVDDLGWNDQSRTFRDLDEHDIRSMFSLYPWEWLLKDFADPILGTYFEMDWIEPIWKMMWSNKALLSVLWEMSPKHPNLLEAHLNTPGRLQNYIRKPLLGREGANITIQQDGRSFATEGPYGKEGYVFQALAPAKPIEGKHCVVGSWYIMDQGPAGIGIRETDQLITDNYSRFVPHYFD